MATPAPITGSPVALSLPDRNHRVAKTAKRCFKSHAFPVPPTMQLLPLGATPLAFRAPQDRERSKKPQGDLNHETQHERSHPHRIRWRRHAV